MKYEFVDDMRIIKGDLPFALWYEQANKLLLERHGSLPPDAEDMDTWVDLYIDCTPSEAADCMIALSEPDDDGPDERTPDERAWWDELEAEIAAM